MIFTGVLINAVLVIIGTMIGLIFKGERLKNIGQRIFEAFALFVLVMGVSGAMDLSEPLIILGSIIAGVAIGEIIDIDKQFTRLGNWLQNKFAKNDCVYRDDDLMSCRLCRYDCPVSAGVSRNF